MKRFVAEMQKAADAADVCAIFFSWCLFLGKPRVKREGILRAKGCKVNQIDPISNRGLASMPSARMCVCSHFNIVQSAKTDN